MVASVRAGRTRPTRDKEPASVPAPVQQPPSPTRRQRLRAGYLARSPRIIAAFAALVGLLTLIGAVWSSERDRVRAITDLLGIPATSAAAAVSAVAGLLLMRLAAGLRKRKRRAWRASVAVTAVLVAAHVLKGHKIAEAAIALVLLIMLVTARSQFRAKADPGSRWFAVRVFFQFIAVALIFGMAMLYLSRDVVGHPPFWARLQEVEYALVGANGPVDVRTERFSDIFHGTLLGFGLLTVAVVALLALRPSRSPGCPRATRSGCACCSTGTAHATRSATSRCAATSRWCGRRPARPRSRTGWCRASRLPAAIRSATPRHGRVRCAPTSSSSTSTAGQPL
jgi:hypothetical protein